MCVIIKQGIISTCIKVRCFYSLLLIHNQNFKIKKKIEKRERETNNEKKGNINNKYLFTFTFLYGIIYIWLENIFGKISYYLYTAIFGLQFFMWQVIGNAVIKHQHPYRYALVL